MLRPGVRGKFDPWLPSGLGWLGPEERYAFPHPRRADPGGFLALGGSLSPGMLLSAYEQGIFPWFEQEGFIHWFSPDPRFVLLPEELHIPRRLRRSLKGSGRFFSFDRAFSQVIRLCAEIPRGDQGTWITLPFIEGYTELHRLGFAHSLEVWRPGPETGPSGGDPETGAGAILDGGLYGISLGSAFFGESMFSLSPGASKEAFVWLARFLGRENFTLLDCQVESPHLLGLGAKNVPRGEYLRLLEAALSVPPRRGSWDRGFFRQFPI
ncbi:MAG: leucyl/phenylalanyl-tRNA--protein transferase [Spirochaetales bacterium]|jgi:leucyl/phenylalanyl-tRNA--protein transferase|nr:leucyl/phenylalanyl-tRNA--protein transferase [Spirochaetales bacterium]